MNRRFLPAVTVAALVVSLAVATQAGASPGRHFGALARSVELSTTSRLADRRSFVIGDRFYEVGAEDGSYPAEGFHTRGEMGGFWSMPIKLLDGVWFGVDGNWLNSSKYTSGWGYARMDLGQHSGVKIQRTDFAPDGTRAGLIGLTLSSSRKRTISLTMDAHSELMLAYPWGETTPSQTAFNLPDTGSYANGNLVFREIGTPPTATATAHNYAAVVGSTLKAASHQLGPNFRGPQDPAVQCGASGPNTPPTPPRCDDTAYGKGTGGQLQYNVTVPAGSRTVWFAIGGSDNGLGEANAMQQRALANPAKLLAQKVAGRNALAKQTNVTLPGDPQLAQSIAWSKQNLADARQEAKNLNLRVTNAGTVDSQPIATQDTAQWIGAGWPDYPWMFGTDGEYTAYAAVAAGQFGSIENHLRTLMQISDKVNKRSGKVVHEVVPDGSVYYGANSDPGNTDETVKFPSTVALIWRWTGDNAFRDSMYNFSVRNLKYVFSQLDADKDGWPEGAGNVERDGMGAEKLDVAVYAIRGLLDLADMAASKHDTATLTWARSKAKDLQKRFEKTWWNGSATKSYADSLGDDNAQIFQRYWIGLTPVEAELPATGGNQPGPLADLNHAVATVAQHERGCYTGDNGLYHTGTGATSDPKGNPGPTCDATTSSAPSDREVFTLTTSIMAVAEAALGRMGSTQTKQYTDDIARVQVDPSVSETPGAMPEISPSPDFGANIDKLFTERSSGLQAWGTYGVLWPVVHYELGVAPDMGRNTVSVVPQVPNGQSVVSGTDIQVGRGSLDVTARRSGNTLTTKVHQHGSAKLTVGALLPTGKYVTGVRLDGHRVGYQLVRTARGWEVLVAAPHGEHNAQLTVQFG
ncbi:MAG: glycogen debranching protein [Jatrophihabitans sp.]